MVRACSVLEVDEETAGWYAELRVGLKEAGTHIPTNDAWIAALCRQHDFVIMSRDRHFDLVKGLRRVPW
jgi:tRNA(fMet)-specific endonuclease VapC